MSDLVITVEDLYTVPAWSGRTGFCAAGARAWAAQHGLDWATMVRDGVTAQVLQATGCAMALHLVQHAQARRDAAPMTSEVARG